MGSASTGEYMKDTRRGQRAPPGKGERMPGWVRAEVAPVTDEKEHLKPGVQERGIVIKIWERFTPKGEGGGKGDFVERGSCERVQRKQGNRKEGSPKEKEKECSAAFNPPPPRERRRGQWGRK